MKGNRRTPCVAIYFYHKDPYEPKYGPIMRLISDLADTTKIVGAMDTGTEQRPLGAYRTDFMDLFHDGGFIDMPTLSNPDTPLLRIRKSAKADNEEL